MGDHDTPPAPDAATETAATDPEPVSDPSKGGEDCITIRVDGEHLTIDPATTVAEIKDVVGAGSSDLLTWKNDGELVQFDDEDQRVAKYVDDGAKLNVFPDSTFGEPV